MLFAIKEKDQHIMLEIDFIRRAIIFRSKDHDRTEYSFKQIMCVLQGKDHDQFIIEFNIKHVKKYELEAIYQGQRDLIVKILIYASEIFDTTDNIDLLYEEAKNG